MTIGILFVNEIELVGVVFRWKSEFLCFFVTQIVLIMFFQGSRSNFDIEGTVRGSI